VVHAAGVTHSQLLVRTTDADVEALVRTNLLGAVYVSRAAVRSMLPRRRGKGMMASVERVRRMGGADARGRREGGSAALGCLVLVGSAVGTGGNAGQTVYSATKAALMGARGACSVAHVLKTRTPAHAVWSTGLSRSLAKEVGPTGIRCNVVAPGLVDTAMAAGAYRTRCRPRPPRSALVTVGMRY
jgi:3-oxoacyl-[acyl-carrier protein] reductase